MFTGRVGAPGFISQAELLALRVVNTQRETFLSRKGINPACEEALTSVFTLITPSSVRVLVSTTENPSACRSRNIFWEYKGQMRAAFIPSSP